MVRENDPGAPKKEWSPAEQKVTCSMCKREYICLQTDDYYNSTCSTDGVCENCLKKQYGIGKIIDQGGPGRPENN